MSSFLRIPSLTRLANELSKLPGIGSKTAERLALSVVKKNAQEVELLSEALKAVKERIQECRTCYGYTEMQEECDFCLDEMRSENPLLCVVKSPVDIAKVESSGAFCGRYHVLHGCIAPLSGVGPEDIKLKELFERVEKLKNQGLTEIVLALDSDLESDTTALYIKEILEPQGIAVTRLAHGVPIGTYMDFVDQRTLGKALENRVKV